MFMSVFYELLFFFIDIYICRILYFLLGVFINMTILLLLRILGFIGMVLVLWSPVAVPLLPTLVRGWTTNTSSRIAELFCIGGLYTAIMILVMLWGRRIRGYEDALEQYGLDLTSSQKVCFRAKSVRRNLDVETVGSLACYIEECMCGTYLDLFFCQNDGSSELSQQLWTDLGMIGRKCCKDLGYTID